MQYNSLLFWKNSFTSEINKLNLIMKILGLGNALADVLIQLSNDDLIKQLNLPKGSMQLIESSDIPRINKYIGSLPTIMASGGSAANTIHGLAKMKAECGYIGRIGHDECGDFYENDLKKAGVHSMLNRSQTPTGRAFTFITPDSERTFATYLGAAVELRPEDINPTIYRDYELLHIEGYLVNNTSFIEKALKTAKACNLKISLDLSSYNVVEANREFLKKTIPEFVDIVFANEEESKAYTGKNPLEAVNEIAAQCDVAVVKIGKDGALIKSQDQFIKIEAVPANIIDTTGAGDQFAAGFLFGSTQNLDLDKCGKLGALLAGQVIETFGARILDKHWPEILEKIKRILK
jgi:sugar/nucleoside kinase (ribokinase family)